MSSSKISIPPWVKNLGALGGWAASTMLSVIDLWALQNAFVKIAVWAGTLRSSEQHLRDLTNGSSYGWTVETIRMTALLVLLCVVVGFEVWVEYFYRRGASQGLLAKRVIRVTLIQALIAVAGVLATLIF